MSADSSAQPGFHFEGFRAPQYTPVPDELFDILLPELSESELKVLLYIIRRTFGFKKDSDNISLRQMTDGIVTRDGKRLDYGAGISKTSVVRGVNGLIDKGVIVAIRNASKEKGDEPTTYRLRFLDDPVSTFETPPSPNLDSPRVPNLDTQETASQQTDEQEEDSNLRKIAQPYDKDRDALRPIVTDFARELGDEAPLASSLTRVLALYRVSGLHLETFVERLYQARAITQERTASITKKRQGDAVFASKNKWPYFMRVLEGLVTVAPSVESEVGTNPA